MFSIALCLLSRPPCLSFIRLEYLLPSVCHSNEALLETAKNNNTTLTFSHYYLDGEMKTLTSNDNILIIYDLIDAFSQISSSSL